jgi:hypothetical protein
VVLDVTVKRTPEPHAAEQIDDCGLSMPPAL